MELLVLAGDATAAVAAEAAGAAGLGVHRCATTNEALELLAATPTRFAALVAALGRGDADSCWPLLAAAKARAPQLFAIVYSHTAQSDPKMRLQCFGAGARMVTSYPAALQQALAEVASTRASGGALRCGYCGLEGLSESGLHRHLDLYHTYEPNVEAPCPLCGDRTPAQRGGLAVHFHNSHGPPERREHPIGRCSLAAFALVVCQRPSDGKFLLVQEPLGIGGGYWLPAGRVDPGETLVQGGVREALEEAGVAVAIKSVLRFTLTDALRVIYLAHPVEAADDTPKTVPDFESAGSLWVSADVVTERLTAADCRSGRATEPLEWFPKVAAGETGCALDTPGYRALEQAVLQLGAERVDDPMAVLSSAWEQLQREMPAHVFKGRLRAEYLFD